MRDTPWFADSESILILSARIAKNIVKIRVRTSRDDITTTEKLGVSDCSSQEWDILRERLAANYWTLWLDSRKNSWASKASPMIIRTSCLFSSSWLLLFIHWCPSWPSLLCFERSISLVLRSMFISLTRLRNYEIKSRDNCWLTSK